MDAALTRWLAPVWRSPTVIDEPVVLRENPAGAIEGRLLFRPDRDIVVTDATGAQRLRLGVEVIVEPAERRLLLPSRSGVPFVAASEPPPTDPSAVRATTLRASYTPADDRWDGPTPGSEVVRLPRTTAGLRRRSPCSIVVLGDSIAAGYDASGTHDVAPHQPGFATLVVEGLRRQTGTNVTLHNLAVPGSTSEDGRWLAAEAAGCRPDLVLVAYGMNDACYADADLFAGNVDDIVRRVVHAHPEAECLLISPMRPTSTCTWVVHERFTEYRSALIRLTGERPGVALADVTALWDTILTRKHAHDLSGNGSNHPNDFGHRLYAHAILAALGA